MRERNVHTMQFQLGFDGDGEPAIAVWVVIEDDAPESSWSRESLNRFRRKVRVALEKFDLAPVVYFRTESEHEEIVSSESL